jgi:hypothetical protein
LEEELLDVAIAELVGIEQNFDDLGVRRGERSNV